MRQPTAFSKMTASSDQTQGYKKLVYTSHEYHYWMHKKKKVSHFQCVYKKMTSSSDQTQGYQCEFKDSVSEDFYCKNCTLVARG